MTKNIGDRIFGSSRPSFSQPRNVFMYSGKKKSLFTEIKKCKKENDSFPEIIMKMESYMYLFMKET